MDLDGIGVIQLIQRDLLFLRKGDEFTNSMMRFSERHTFTDKVISQIRSQQERIGNSQSTSFGVNAHIRKVAG